LCYNKFMNQKQVMDLFKRFIIVFVLVCIPLVTVLTLCTKLSSALVIVFSVLGCGLVFALVEYFLYKTLKKRKERREKYKKDN